MANKTCESGSNYKGKTQNFILFYQSKIDKAILQLPLNGAICQIFI